MNKFVHIPAEPLSKFVKYMWFQSGYQPSSQVEHILPGGGSQIILNLDTIPFRHLSSDLKTEYTFDDFILTGVHSKPVFLDSSTRISTIGIVLKEGAIPSLLNIPAAEFHNRVIPLDDLPLSNISKLRDMLHNLSKPENKLQVLEAYLHDRFFSGSSAPNPAACYAVEQIRNHNGNISITEILNKTGYSRRWFIDLFRQTVGITPKCFARLIRFQHTLDLIQTSKTPHLTAIALQGGYYDQSHFNHDFREFGGISPMAYYNNRGEEKNHLLINPE